MEKVLLFNRFWILLLPAIWLPGVVFGLEPDPQNVFSSEKLKPSGQWQEATVPDTLNLAEHAQWSINVLTGNVEPNKFYGVYQSSMFNPPELKDLTWNITPKNARTLPLLRVMTGSTENLDIQVGIMQALTNEITENGQMYYPFDGAGPPKGTSYPQTNAQTIFAMLNHYHQTGNPAWLEWIDTLAKGLRASAIQVEDRAYYPMQSGIDREGQWHFMHHSNKMAIPYTPPDEPESDQQGLEGAAKSDQNRCMSALVKHWRLTGDEDSLQMARKILRFILKPALWADTANEGFPGHEHAIWYGHFHNGVQGLMAILDLALATNDDWLRQFVREGYDHARRMGVIRMGWFPMWSTPTKFNRPVGLMEVTEPCALADMVCLAVMLNDAGLGNYWDDVDYIIRNHLIAQQVTDLDRLRRAAGVEQDSDEEAVLQRIVGGFGCGSPFAIEWNYLPGCCSVNGAQSIYYAWHGITRFDNGVATVNLFLNRASPWMDIDSYLPYEGKVVLRNKRAHTVMIRIPVWVEEDKVRCFLNDQPVQPPRAGGYWMVQDLEQGDVIRLEFPVPERTDPYTFAGKEYTVSFRGSTVVDISPHPEDSDKYAIYMREGLKASQAPMRQIRRFVADKLIPLGTF